MDKPILNYLWCKSSIGTTSIDSQLSHYLPSDEYYIICLASLLKSIDVLQEASNHLNPTFQHSDILSGKTSRIVYSNHYSDLKDQPAKKRYNKKLQVLSLV